MTQYEKAPEVEDISKELITTLPLDDGIVEAKIAYLFVLKKESYFKGQIQKPEGALQVLLEYDFVMLIHKNTWNELDENQKKALVYHELLHVTHTETKEGKIVWKLRRHEVEEFVQVVRHFGNWSEELRVLEDAGKEKE